MKTIRILELLLPGSWVELIGPAYLVVDPAGTQRTYHPSPAAMSVLADLELASGCPPLLFREDVLGYLLCEFGAADEVPADEAPGT